MAQWNRAILGWPIGMLLLGSSIACLAFAGRWYVYEDRTVVMVPTRGLDHPMPPWTYDDDWFRFFGLVVQPLCPGAQGAQMTPQGAREVQTVAERCEIVAGPCGPATDCAFVRVTPRQGLVRGADARPVEAEDVRVAIHRLQAEGCRSPSVDGPQPPSRAAPTSGGGDAEMPCLWGRDVSVASDGTLHVFPAREISPQLLWRQLQLAPVAFNGKAGELEGTGPFVVREIWRRGSSDAGGGTDVAPASDKSNPPASSRTPPYPLPSLAAVLIDEVVLERRESAAGRIRRVVFAGVWEPTEPRTAHALVASLNAQEVHLVRQAEAPLGTRLQVRAASRTGPWRVEQRPLDGVLFAFLTLGPEHLSPPECRESVLRALRAAACRPEFLRAIHAQPALQPLPSPTVPVYRQSCPRIAQAPSSCCTGRNPHCGDAIRLLSNSNWANVATRLRVELEEACLQVDVVSLDPGQETKYRHSGDFDISLLAFRDQWGTPAHFLLDNLSVPGWFEPSERALKELRRLAGDEADARMRGQPPNVRDLGAVIAAHIARRVVALGSPNSWDARNLRLRGLDPGVRYLDDATLDLDRPFPLWPFIVGGIAFVAAFPVSLVASVRARRAAARQRRVLQEADFFHHQMSSPLSAIKAHADLLRETDPETGSTIRAEADAALDIVDRVRLIARPDGVAALPAEARTADFWGQVVEPEVRSLRERAGVAGIAVPTIEMHGPSSPLPSLRLVPGEGRIIVRNLLDNALKYRGRASNGLRVAVRCWPQGDRVLLSVEDWGMGIRVRFANWRLFRFGRRTRHARREHVAASGLGLYLCRRLLRQVGGRIRLANRADPTRFVVELRVL